MTTTPLNISTLGLFLLAALAEIGGGYLIWLWIKQKKRIIFAIVGGLILFTYGIIPTLQPSNFGRIYAAYGGFFIALSLLWGWMIDRNVPDRFDVVGAVVSLVGVCIIMYWPR